MNFRHNSVKMKCYFYHEQKHFLGYFSDLVSYDAVIYASDVSFQNNEREGRYTEFIGNPTGTNFVADKRDQEILLSQRNNASNMLSNSNNFRQLSVNENCTNLTQIALANSSDTSHPTYHAKIEMLMQNIKAGLK